METYFKPIVGNKKVEIYYAMASFSGYGHKRITVELYYNGEYKEFKATTNNMPAYNEAMELEGPNRYRALYRIIEHQIFDEVCEWLDNL